MAPRFVVIVARVAFVVIGSAGGGSTLRAGGRLLSAG